MADSPMPTVLFISVFVFLFFKFCIGVPQLAPVGPFGPLGPLAGGHQDDAVDGGLSRRGRAEGLASNMAFDAAPPLPLVRKCPVGSVYSVAVGGCKDLVRSPKDPSQKMLLLMPYLLAATQHQHQQQQRQQQHS